MSVFWYQVYQARLWECLLTVRGLPSNSACVLKAEPGKLDIKRREPGILFISWPNVSLFKLAIMTYFSIFVLVQRHLRRHSKSAMSSWPDKGNMPRDSKRLLGYVETIQLILGVSDKIWYQGWIFMTSVTLNLISWLNFHDTCNIKSDIMAKFSCQL